MTSHRTAIFWSVVTLRHVLNIAVCVSSWYLPSKNFLLFNLEIITKIFHKPMYSTFVSTTTYLDKKTFPSLRDHNSWWSHFLSRACGSDRVLCSLGIIKTPKVISMTSRPWFFSCPVVCFLLRCDSQSDFVNPVWAMNSNTLSTDSTLSISSVFSWKLALFIFPDNLDCASTYHSCSSVQIWRKKRPGRTFLGKRRYFSGIAA